VELESKPDTVTKSLEKPVENHAKEMTPKQHSVVMFLNFVFLLLIVILHNGRHGDIVLFHVEEEFIIGHEQRFLLNLEEKNVLEIQLNPFHVTLMLVLMIVNGKSGELGVVLLVVEMELKLDLVDLFQQRTQENHV